MNALALRKQLLIAETELNRAQLVEEWNGMTAGVRSVADQARTIRSLASGAALLIAGLMYFQRTKSAPAGAKPSWWRTLLKGAQWAGTLWLEFYAQPERK